MIPHDVATQAVDILVRLFREFSDQLSDQLAGRVADAAVKKALALYAAVRDRLSPGRESVLEDVVRHPDDLAARRSLREELAALMADEPSFHAELTRRVVEYNIQPTATVNVSGDVGSGSGHEVDVTISQPVNLINVHPTPRGPAARPQFEPPPPDYVGRGAQLAEAARVLGNHEKGAPVALVIGAPGMGKTAFAHVLASRLGRRGYRNAYHLEVRLGGEGQPEMSAEEALGLLLRQLGVPDDEIDPGVQARRDRYRAELRRKPALVVLDGAVSAAQVEPLLPSEGSGAVVTSRSELGELLEHGARRIRLRPLTGFQAFGFLTRRLSRERVMREPGAAIAIVRACRGLPLALTTLTGQLRTAAGEHLPLREVLKRLSDPDKGLDEFAVGEVTVEQVLQSSYNALTKEQQHVFEVVGLLDVPEVDAEVVAAAADLLVATAKARLGELANSSLLEVAGRPGDRWRMHDVIRQFARRMAEQHQTAEARQGAVDRAVGVYLSRVRSWREVLRSDAARLDPAIAAEARAQLEQEARQLVTLLDRAVSLQVGWLAWALGELLGVLFDAITMWPEVDSSREAVDAVAQAAERRQHMGLQARALYALALSLALHGRPDQAHRLLGQALSLAGQAGDGALLQAIGAARGRLDGRDWAWPSLDSAPPGWATERPVADPQLRSPNGPRRAWGEERAAPDFGPAASPGGPGGPGDRRDPGGADGAARAGGPAGPGGRPGGWGGGPGPTAPPPRPPRPDGGDGRSTRESRLGLRRSVFRGASGLARSFEANGWWALWAAAIRVRLWAADRAPDGVRVVTYRELGDVYAARGLRAKAADAYTTSQKLDQRRLAARRATAAPERVDAVRLDRSRPQPTVRQAAASGHRRASPPGRDRMTAVWDATRTDIGSAARAWSAGRAPEPAAEAPVAAGEPASGLDAGLAAVRAVRGAATPSVQPVTFGRR